MSETVMEKFWSLCRAATRACEDSPDTMTYEHEFLKVLQFVKGNPEYKDQFSEAFVGMVLEPQFAVWEIVMFCMRELKWPQVHQAAQAMFLSPHTSIDNRRIVERILEVYEDEWEDSDLFNYYSV